MATLPPPTINYQVVVEKVIDGDTLKVQALSGWPAFDQPDMDVRIYGIDTPEHIMPPAQAACEVALGIKASTYARSIVAVGSTVILHYTWGYHDKYGRILATVTLPNGQDYGTAMVVAGFARPYGADGSLHKTPWCK
jgi:micrococcal nuclease